MESVEVIETGLWVAPELFSLVIACQAPSGARHSAGKT